MTLSRAALDLLTRAASGTSTLIAVDDVPWLDRASGRVLAFIARRTAGARLGFLATMRTGEEGLFDQAGIGAYELRSSWLCWRAGGLGAGCAARDPGSAVLPPGCAAPVAAGS
jgi:hypothetical protein